MRIYGWTDMDGILKALGDPTRLRIVQMLAQNGEMCVCRFVDELEMNQPAISHHMAKLKQAGLLNARKEGQWIHYSLRVEALKDGLVVFLAEIVSQAEASASAVNDTPCCE
jgi:DNA-binding transcriptional ArsR family regulator